MDHSPQPERPPLTPARVAVTLLLFITAGLLIALFITPNSSPWFWPIAGAMLLSGLAAYFIPLGPKSN
ncbi:MAG: hypothetical protein SFZ24_04005 [Planctomycetota bacterium]|nr:hypothetical protein [Planctomycetota bacterium]